MNFLLFVIFLSSFLANGYSRKLPFFEFNPKTFDSLLNTDMEIRGDISVNTSAKTIEFGKTGVAKINSFSFPESSFTIEAFVQIDFFNDYSSHNISSILSTATWDGREQGIDLRFGGGIYYPALPEDANLWNSHAGGDAYSFSSSPQERAALSSCLAELAVATSTVHHFKEHFSEYCLNTKEWYHIVATWDGKQYELYVNGVNAIDSVRINSPELNPQVDQDVPLFIGARGFVTSDSRHLNGRTKFINIYSYKMEPSEILTISDSLFEKSTPICEFEIKILSPLSGEICTRESRFVLNISDNGMCEETFENGNFEILVQASTSSNFDENIWETTIEVQDFKIKDLGDFAKNLDYRYLFWRFTLKPKEDSVLTKKTARNEADWSFSVPVFLQLSDSGATGINQNVLIEALNLEINRKYLINGKKLPGDVLNHFGKQIVIRP